MQSNLIIVESPTKATTIKKFLGNNYKVLSSYGHIRDLKDKELSIDIQNNFKPEYAISPKKILLIKQLKQATKEAQMVWLASDEDREGEAIAWHLYVVLGLNEKNSKRIVFHEITKEAVLQAIANPRKINYHLVNAQQARRILDRIVGFELSPILWKKIMPSLSAGRVQSVAVRLIVEKEKEINACKIDTYFPIHAQFLLPDEKTIVQSKLNKKFKTEDEVKVFLEKIKQAIFTVEDISIRFGKKSPLPPFTTSSLQQEAFSKIGFSVVQTMTIAQKLYESGKITYMRTDSVNLSSLALDMAQKEISNTFGDKYVNIHQYSTKKKEAHEAIRPTCLHQRKVNDSLQEQRLYQLIWNRTIASQMADAKVERTTIFIKIDNYPTYQFQLQGEVIQFDGFLKVYLENMEDDLSKERMEKIIPIIRLKEKLNLIKATASEHFTQHPPKYNEASLVKKLEELGIGRPSTYAPIISTIQNRKYIIKKSNEGEKKSISLWMLKNQIISKTTITKTVGVEKNKLIPTDSGLVVNDFLVKNFPNILEYDFTANLEKEFDKIALGKLKWTEILNKFYQLFHPIVEKVSSSQTIYKIGERILGINKEGKTISVKIGRFGPFVQIGSKKDKEKPKFAPLIQGQSIHTLTLEEALALFNFPKKIGTLKNKPITVAIGRFGPYLKFDDTFISISKQYDPYRISIQEAKKLIKEKEEHDSLKIIKSFPEKSELKILNGRFGLYIKYQKKNYKLPQKIDLSTITYQDVIRIIEENQTKNRNRKVKDSQK